MRLAVKGKAPGEQNRNIVGAEPQVGARYGAFLGGKFEVLKMHTERY